MNRGRLWGALAAVCGLVIVIPATGCGGGSGGAAPGQVSENLPAQIFTGQWAGDWHGDAAGADGSADYFTGQGGSITMTFGAGGAFSAVMTWPSGGGPTFFEIVGNISPARPGRIWAPMQFTWQVTSGSFGPGRSGSGNGSGFIDGAGQFAFGMDMLTGAGQLIGPIGGALGRPFG